MRKQDIQLRILARQGDKLARLKLGRLYLSGADGMPRNITAGLSYLRNGSEPLDAETAMLIAGAMRLEEMLEHGQLDALYAAAQVLPGAQVNLAVWLLLIGEKEVALDLLDRASASSVLKAWRSPGGAPRLRAAIQAAAMLQRMDVRAVALSAVQLAQRQGNLARMIDALAVAGVPDGNVDTSLSGAVVEAVALAEERGHSLGDLGIAQIQSCLEKLATQGDNRACYILGRALSGINCGSLPWQRLVEGNNLRKGSAMLLRAADSGMADAWLQLYRISADNRCSVSNPQMARFCLEKAAQCGITEAERRLGALQMREAASLTESERALDMLFRAASKGDAHAHTLLSSLVLEVPGADEEVFSLIDEVQRIDPWLGMRLRLARHFGLTKQEALSVDPASGARPWGLVVGYNPFIAHIRLSSPRAVPAVTPDALACAAAAATFFSSDAQNHDAIEGNLRKRSFNQRRIFERMRLKDEIFFATANSSQRDALRIGSRWAHRSRHALRLALAEHTA